MRHSVNEIQHNQMTHVIPSQESTNTSQETRPVNPEISEPAELANSQRKYRKQKNPGNSVYSTEVEKHGQTTVTFKESQVEKKTTQVTINSNPLSYFTNPIQRTQKRKFPPQESSTLQVVRLTRYRSNFPSSNHSQNSSSVRLCSFLTILVVVAAAAVVGGRKAWEKSTLPKPKS